MTQTAKCDRHPFYHASHDYSASITRAESMTGTLKTMPVREKSLSSEEIVPAAPHNVFIRLWGREAGGWSHFPMRTVEGHEDHRVALTSGRDINGSEIGLSVCVSCRLVVREVRLCGHPTRTRSRRPCRAFLDDDLSVTGCPRHRQAAPKAPPAKPAVVNTEAALLDWFRRERAQWYTLNDIINGVGVSERTCKRWLPLLVARGHLVRIGSVGRNGMRYQLNDAVASGQAS